MGIKCTRCNKIIKKEESFIHKCSGIRDLNGIPDDLLLKIIKKEITEEEAWVIIDGKAIS